MNNTINHVSDSAKYVTFTPTGDWDKNITDVQTALASIKGFAVNGVPNASELESGVIAIASQEEVNDGQDHTKAVTPKTLHERLQRPDATKTEKGVARFSTNDEVLVKTNDSVMVAPDTLDHFFITRKSSESVQGTIKICSLDAAKAGTDDTTAVTPKKMHMAISQLVPGLIPEQNTATESRVGLVRLATSAQTSQGSLREEYAISPYAFVNARASESKVGTIKIASAAEMTAGSDDTVAVSAKKFAQTRATATQFGTVKLSETITNQANTALSANAKVLPLSGGVVTGNVYKGSNEEGNQFITKKESGGMLPVASIILSAVNKDDETFMICNGRSLLKSKYPELFSKIGYLYGGSGDNFNLPDMRGLVARGCDLGRGLDPNREFGSYQEDAMQKITGRFSVASRWRGVFGGVFKVRHGQWNTNYKNGGGDDWGAVVDFDTSTQARTADETRVKSLALNYIIRVK